jgi:acetylglutamate kinase
MSPLSQEGTVPPSKANHDSLNRGIYEPQRANSFWYSVDGIKRTIGCTRLLSSLTTEMRRVTASIPQSWMQSGMQAVIEQAVQSMVDKLNAEVLNTEKDSNRAK